MTTLSYKRYESLSTLSISSPQRLNLQLTYAENERESQVELRLENTLDTDIAQWTLHLDLQRDVCAGKGTVMTRCGSHLRLTTDGEQALAPGQACSLQLIGPPRLLQRLSDLPAGLFLLTEDAREISGEIIGVAGSRVYSLNGTESSGWFGPEAPASVADIARAWPEVHR